MFHHRPVPRLGAHGAWGGSAGRPRPACPEFTEGLVLSVSKGGRSQTLNLPAQRAPFDKLRASSRWARHGGRRRLGGEVGWQDLATFGRNHSLPIWRLENAGSRKLFSYKALAAICRTGPAGRPSGPLSGVLRIVAIVLPPDPASLAASGFVIATSPRQDAATSLG